MLRLRVLALLLVALPLTVLLGAPQVASAGTFTELTCSPTTGAGNWQQVDTYASGLTVGNMCGGLASGPNEPQGPTNEGALFAEDGPNITADIPDGAEAGWRFAAPAGLTITGISYWRSLHAYNQQSLVPGLWTGEGTTLESCESPPEGTHECNSLNNQGLITFANLNTSSLFFGVRCNLVGGDEYCATSGGMNHFAQADLYSANVTLSETASPSISSVAGAPWGGGVLSGEVPLTLSASDYSGIESVSVRSSAGVLLGSEVESCDYYDPVPCPDLSSAAINLNTTQAPDGLQSLILTVQDAAGNKSTETSPQILIDNNGPASPTNLAATLSGNEILLSWINPVSPPIPIGSATVALCSTTCTATAVSASGGAHIAAPAPGTYTVQLSLTDIAGKTSAPASTIFTVPPPSMKPPGKPVKKLQATIEPNAYLSVAGPVPKGFSGRVHVCWRSMRDKRVLGSRCTTLHVKHGVILVIFHTSARARRGKITVTVSAGRRILVRLTAGKLHTA
jgi:hypothetical protein